MTQQPQAKYRKDYTAPDFTITHIDLDFDLLDSHARVTAKSQVKQMVAGADSMILDGDGLTLKKSKLMEKRGHITAKQQKGLFYRNCRKNLSF